MLKNAIWISAFALSTSVFAETLTLRPGAEGKDALLFSRMDSENQNFGNSPSFWSATWTWNSQGLGQGTFRGLLAFGLEAIPATAKVNSARLQLFADAGQSFTQGHTSLTNSNASYLQRVTAAWDENTVTWMNQPATDPATQLTLAQSESPSQNYDVDVTAMVADMVANPASNHGFLLRSISEATYNAMTFGSGDHVDPALRPMLVVDYEVVTPGLTVLRPGAEGKDASIFSRVDAVDINYGNDPNLQAATWTWNAQGLGQGTYRSLLQFDLASALPAGAIFKSATLTLYANTQNWTNGHTSLTQSNAAWLKRVNGAWGEDLVTWNNQPATDTGKKIVLAQSDSANQDYILDVSGWISFMIANPSMNHGFMLESQAEAPYNALWFGSSDNADAALRPKLEIRYEMPAPDPDPTEDPNPGTIDLTGLIPGNYILQFVGVPWHHPFKVKSK